MILAKSGAGARRRKSRALCFFLLLVLMPLRVFAQEDGEPEPDPEPEPELDIEELRRRITGEAPGEIMAFSLLDSEVSLFLTGSWKGELQGNAGFSVSPFGTNFVSPETPLLFKQEADITMSLWINDRWFVEANFLDDSSLNTYRAGYQGLPGEFLKYAGIGNTGLDFPSFPYLDLGGDSPSSFGFYSRFGSDNLNIHALFRYDAASREERIFSGGRERTYSYIQPQNSVRGVSFVLPDINIDSEITVYIEDEKGTVRDSGGRRWRIAQPSEYAAGRAQGLLEINIRPEGMIAVSYSKGGNARPWDTSMGDYGTNGFLNTVQQWFAGIDLASYPQSGGGGSSRPGEVIFGSIRALVIREPGTFSPFERLSRYDSPSSASQEAELVSVSSGKGISGYTLVLLDTDAASASLPAYSAANRRGVYELLPQGNFSLRDPGDSRDPRLLWPLAAEYPEIYLPSAGVFTGDITLRFTNYNNQGGYYIGTDVVPGSVQVWRSGMQDTNFSYNSSSGEVSIYGPAGYNENIRITYLKISDETRLGSIAAGLGAVYSGEENPFSARAAIGARMNLTDENSFTQNDAGSAGTVGLGAKLQWDYDFFKADVTAGFAFVQTDTTGLYRAAGMEGNETVLALPSGTSFISHPPSSAFAPGLDISNRAGLIYRNYNSNNVFDMNLMYVESDAPIISGMDKPYPVRDTQLGDTQVLAAEFMLDNARKWTGFQVPLDYSTGVLSRAGEIEIPYRFYGFSGNTAGFRLIVQIGSLSGKDFAFAENPDLVWEKEIFPSGGAFDAKAHIARFSLDDDDRLKLADARYLRVIAVNDTAGNVSGRVLIAPPIVRGASFRAVTLNGDTVKGSHGFSSPNNRVTALEMIDTGAASLSSAYGDIIKRLHPSANTQRVMRIEWENMEPGFSAGIDGRLGELPLADYRELSFFVKAPDNTQGSISFIAADGPQSVSDSDSRLVARVPMNALMAGQWSKVTIRYQGSGTGVYVDGARAANAFLSYRPDRLRADGSARRNDYAAIFINPDSPSPGLGDGTVFIDEIILEDPVTVFRMNAGAGVEYSRPGTLLSINEIPVLADFSVTSAFESEFLAESESADSQARGSAAGRTGAGISFFGVNISGNFSFTAAEETFLWSADHKISRLLGPFYLEGSFYASPGENAARRNINMSYSSDFYANFAADALYEFSLLKQKWNLGAGYNSQNDLIPSAAVSAEALWTGGRQIAPDEGYGELWTASWEPLVPDTGEGADSRKIQTQIVITQRSKPVGAVVTLEGGSNFSGANSITVLENSSFLDIPFVFNRFSFNLRGGRSFKRSLFFAGNDALDDGSKFFESVNDSLSGWTVFPGYSLFAPEMADAVYSGLDNSPSADIALYTVFTDHFSANIVLPEVYSLASFFVPSKAALRLDRTLEKKLDTKTDMLALGGSIGFSAINMFGYMGYRPLFNFYQTDEYTHAVEAAVIIPVNEEVSWRIQSAAGAGFRGFSGGTLNLKNTLTINSGGYWLESFTADWTVPSEKSLLSVFYDWIAEAAAGQSSWLSLQSLLNQDYEQFRTESLELAFDKTGDYLRWTVSMSHEETIRILGRLNFTAYIKLRCSQDLQSEVFIFDALLGTALRVSF